MTNAELQRYVFDTFIANDRKVDVYVGTLIDGCILPEGLEAVTLLNVWLDGPGPKIDDLHVDEDGWSASLSFNRSPFHCYVPWEAVQGLRSVSGDGTILTLVYEVDRRAVPRANDNGPGLTLVGKED